MKQNSKELIVNTALQLFATNGYSNTPVSLIAKTAGIAQGLMYNFFSSKEDLLNEVLSRGFIQVKETMQIYAKEKDAKKAISNHIDATFILVQKNKQYWKLFHTIRMQKQVELFMETHYKTATEFVIHTLAKNFKKLNYAKPKLEAKLFFATVDGIVMHYLYDEKFFSLKEMKKYLTEKYII